MNLKFTLDNVMKKRTEQGLGIKTKQASTLSAFEIDLLWSLGLLGTSTPEQLFHTTVFSLGLGCALRAGKEHKALRSVPFNSQFTFHQDSEGKVFFRYTEDIGLKTNKGGIKHRKFKPKVVDVYQIDDPERCPVRILLKLISMLPEGRTCQSLYLQPRKKFSQGELVSG